MVQNFTVFMDRSAAAKIRTTKCLARASGIKLKTTKISSEGLGGNTVKFCTSENFPLYSIS